VYILLESDIAGAKKMNLESKTFSKNIQKSYGN
jgi:hypothetical protein